MFVVQIFILTSLSRFLICQSQGCDSGIIELIGAGSSFPSAMYQELGAAYAANRSLDRKIYFLYNRFNSVYGKERIKMVPPYTEPILFAGTEAPLTAEEKKKFPELITFPTVAGALAIVFNLPKINQINLTASSVVDIYIRKITYWNDPVIQSVNPTVVLPQKKILLVARSDAGAGDTLIFTSALSSISREWAANYGVFVDPQFVNNECCNSTKWDDITFYGNRVTGLIGVVASIPYTIGYAAWANTLGTGVTYAKIINARGTAVEPTVDSVQSAMDYFLTEGVKNNTDGLEYSINNALSESAYPFASFSYMIVNRTTHPNISFCQVQELTGFISWLFTVPTFNDFSKYGLVRLSDKVKNYILQSVLPAIQYQGKSAYTEFLISLEHPVSNYMRNMVTIAFALLALALVTIGIALVYYRRNKVINDSQWLLKDVLLNRACEGSCITLNETLAHTTSASGSFAVSSTVSSAKKSYFVEGKRNQTDVKLFLTEFNMKREFSWNNKTKIAFNKFLKEIHHINVLPFLGVALVDTKIYLVNQHTTIKGTVHYVLKTCPYQIDSNIKVNLACDVLEGLKYLHNHNIAHGTLSSLNCYVDVVWTVKIALWEFGPVSRTENMTPLESLWSKIINTEIEEIESNERLIQLLYLDPDYFTNTDKPSFHSDIYGYGVLLVEIFTRNIPYSGEVELNLNDYLSIINDKYKRNHFEPPMSVNNVSVQVQNLVGKCLLLPYTRRIELNNLHKTMVQISGTRKSVVDILMLSMENYMNSLEEKVIERTTELSSVTNRMRDLLNDVLPKEIATKLLYGEPVEPEFYECCSIMFSDIVGFTTISAKSTPIQVMTFLNDLYQLFDKTIEQYDAYKVDTIGDAYMAASGVPVRNGIMHCKFIGLFALALMDSVRNFQIAHLPHEELKIRLGINSGPVTAGIIGNKMPQYCLFGDTVNTASRMESTSVPHKIQVSETSYKLFVNFFPEFSFELRGEVEIKGKGKMKTYWLLSSTSRV